MAKIAAVLLFQHGSERHSIPVNFDPVDPTIKGNVPGLKDSGPFVFSADGAYEGVILAAWADSSTLAFDLRFSEESNVRFDGYVASVLTGGKRFTMNIQPVKQQ